MSSGSYMPPPVLSVEMPKPDGGVRKLGIPTIADRVAQIDAEAEIERLMSELAAAVEMLDAQASLDDGDETEDPFEPTGYADRARVWVDDARSVFDMELVDSSWAPDAESELYENIQNQIAVEGLQAYILDVKCKTEACRVQLSYARQPVDNSDLGTMTQPTVELAREVARAVDAVSRSGLIHNRGMFPGELATSELYLFRTGQDGIVHTSASQLHPVSSCSALQWCIVPDALTYYGLC